MNNDIETYRELYAEFCKIDDFNLADKAKQVPSQKQFWASRLIDAKRDRAKLLKQKKVLKATVLERLTQDSPVSLGKKTMDELDNSPQLEKINEKIEEVEFLVEYLELIFKCVSFIAQDVKNIIDSAKLQSGDY